MEEKITRKIWENLFWKCKIVWHGMYRLLKADLWKLFTSSFFFRYRIEYSSNVGILIVRFVSNLGPGFSTETFVKRSTLDRMNFYNYIGFERTERIRRHPLLIDYDLFFYYYLSNTDWEYLRKLNRSFEKSCIRGYTIFLWVLSSHPRTNEGIPF